MLKLSNALLAKSASAKLSGSLVSHPVKCIGTYRRRIKMPWEDEKNEYKRNMHEYRLKNIKEFWDRQSLFENEFIGRYLHQELHLISFLDDHRQICS